MNISVTWKVPPSVLEQGMTRYGEQVRQAVLETGRLLALNFQQYAQINARWTDRTKRARNGLIGFADQVSNDLVRIYLTTQAPYGVWLELKYSGRYAIVMPTIYASLPQVKRLLDNIFR